MSGSDYRNLTSPRPNSGTPKDMDVFRIVVGAVDLFGIIGNCVSYSMLLRFVGSASMYSILRALALTDAFLLTCHLLFNTALFNLLPINRLTMQIGYGYFGFVAQTITIWLTAILSIERMVAIRYPFQASMYITIKRTSIAIGCICSLTVLYKIPLAIVRVHKLLHANATQYCEEDHIMFIVSQEILESLFWWFETVLSIVIVLVCNALVLITLHTDSKRWGRNSDDSRNAERRNTIIPLWVVAMFLISVVPEKLYVALVTYKLAPVTKVLYAICNCGVVFNASANVLVYFCNSPRMRRLVADFVLCRKHERKLTNSEQCERFTTERKAKYSEKSVLST